MTKSKIVTLTEELSIIVKSDAEAIQVIAKAAADEIESILAKYADVPADFALPSLSAGRNVIANMRMHFPPALPTPLAPSPLPMP